MGRMKAFPQNFTYARNGVLFDLQNNGYILHIVLLLLALDTLIFRDDFRIERRGRSYSYIVLRTNLNFSSFGMIMVVSEVRQ